MLKPKHCHLFLYSTLKKMLPWHMRMVRSLPCALHKEILCEGLEYLLESTIITYTT